METSSFYSTLKSPLGEFVLLSDGTALTAVHRIASDKDRDCIQNAQRNDALLADAREQLRAYFNGENFKFTIKLAPQGTPFQRRVWTELRRIPYGETISYKELARRVGQPKASRAVGSANGRNPLMIIVPCHRVIAADGSLGGYGGGLDCKQWLLEHETQALGKRAR